jgi:hypothetical protein
MSFPGEAEMSGNEMINSSFVLYFWGLPHYRLAENERQALDKEVVDIKMLSRH